MAGRLKALGFAVTFASDKTVSATSVVGVDSIVISSSAESGNLGTRLRDVAIPIFCVENGQYPNQGMTPAGVGAGEDSVLAQTAVTIVAAASPLAAGLTGNVTISSKAGELGWGRRQRVRRSPRPSSARPITRQSSASQREIRWSE